MLSKAYKSQGKLIRGDEILNHVFKNGLEFRQVKQGYFKQRREYLLKHKVSYTERTVLGFLKSLPLRNVKFNC